MNARASAARQETDTEITTELTWSGHALALGLIATEPTQEVVEIADASLVLEAASRYKMYIDMAAEGDIRVANIKIGEALNLLARVKVLEGVVWLQELLEEAQLEICKEIIKRAEEWPMPKPSEEITQTNLKLGLEWAQLEGAD